MNKLLKAHKDQLRVVYHTTRVKPNHTLVPLLAQAVEAAANQGKFHEMYEAVFKDQDAFDQKDPSSAEKELSSIASGLGLDLLRFQADLHGDAAKASYARGDKLARSINVNETPSFFFLTPSGRNKRFYTTGGMVEYLKDPRNWK